MGVEHYDWGLKGMSGNSNRFVYSGVGIEWVVYSAIV